VTYPPPYGQPPQPPMAAKKGGRKVLAGCGGIGCFGLLVIVIIAVIGAGTSHKTATPSSPASSVKAAAHPAVAAAAKTVLVSSGDGVKTTQSFTVHGDWDLYWSFICSAAIGSGNFVVTGDGALGDVYANELASHGKDVTHQHHGGRLALDVDSECKWKIKVVDIPG
jgi:hypothetical protein